jgi:hypothetical protein
LLIVWNDHREIEEALMEMAAATEGRVQKGGSSIPLPASRQIDAEDPPYGKENPVSHSSISPNHDSRVTADLRFWRALVFGAIGVLYLISLFVPSLRDALGRLFSYFPQ